MIKHRAVRLFAAGLMLLVLASMISVFAAKNTVPESGLGRTGRAVTANDLKPSECDGLNLTNTVLGGDGTDANSLILGSAISETLRGLGGDDCILGGGGDDTIDGSDGADVCIGGPGNDTFENCETEIQ